MSLSVEAMTAKQVLIELRSYNPGTESEVIRTKEHKTRRQALWRRLDTMTKHQPAIETKKEEETGMPKYNLNNAEKQITGLLPPGVYRGQLKIKSGNVGEGGFLTLAKNFRTCHINIEYTVVFPEEHGDRRLYDLITLEVDDSEDETGLLPSVEPEQMSKYRTAVRIGLSKLRALIESAYGIAPDDGSEHAQKLRDADIAELDGLVPTMKVDIRNYVHSTVMQSIPSPNLRRDLLSIG
jgi:hypothetical protein